MMQMQAKIKCEKENCETQKLRQIWMYEESCYFHLVENWRNTKIYIGNIKKKIKKESQTNLKE